MAVISLQAFMRIQNHLSRYMRPVPAPICSIRLKNAPTEASMFVRNAEASMRRTTETRPTTTSSRSPAFLRTKRFQKSFAM